MTLRLASLYITEGGQKRDISDDYIVLQKQLGEPGQFGKVYSCIRRTDRKPCAVKVINKTRFLKTRRAKDYFNNFRAEIEIQRKIGHPNIVKLYDVYESRSDLMLVMEMCCGGELFDRIVEKANSARGYSERQVAIILKQILSAVAFMHSKNITHCDLKPSNIMFDTNSEYAQVKVIDFGFAQRVPKWKRYLTKSVGTPTYTAPEILYGKYNKEGDMWAIGIIMFAMFFGYTPFQRAGDQRLGTHAENQAIRKRITRGFQGIPRNGKISSAAKNLIHGLLKTNVVERYTADQALVHVWFESATWVDRIPDIVLQKLRKVAAMDHFKVFVLSVFRNNTDLTSTAQLKKYFERFDSNRDNRISLQEFNDGLQSHLPELRDQNVRQMFYNLDIDGDNYIQFDEFCSLIAYQQLINAYERLAFVFDSVDTNSNGFLDRGDVPQLKQALRNDPLIRRLDINLEDVIDLADLNNDGHVSFDEFLFAMHPELLEPNKREQFENRVAKKHPLRKRITKTQRRVASRMTDSEKRDRSRRSHSKTQARLASYEEDYNDKPLPESSFDRILTKFCIEQSSLYLPKSRGAPKSRKGQFRDKLDSEEEVKNYKRRDNLSMSRPRSIKWDDDEKDEQIKKKCYACS